jgi:hypothetical protein
MAYKGASQKAQSRASRPIGEMLPSYFETLTTEQQRDCVKSILFSVIEDRKTEKNKWRYDALGKEISELNKKINEIRPKKKSPNIERFFIDAARETLTKDLFNLVMYKANKMLEASGINPKPSEG